MHSFYTTKHRHIRRTAGIGFSVVIFAALSLFSHSLMAQFTWDGGGDPDNVWSNDLNWGNNTITSGSTLQFGGGTNLDTVNDQAANFSLGALNFLNTLTGNVTITGANVLNLDGTIDVASVGGSTLTHTIDNDLLISALRTIDVNGDETLVISGNMTSDDGADDLRKTGTGTLLLTGTNNDAVNGIDIIQARTGSVQFKVDSNLGKGRIHIGQAGNSGTLEFVGDTGVAVTVDSQVRSTSNAAVVQTILANGATVNDTVIFSNFGDNGNGDTLILGGDNTGNNQITDDLGDLADASLTKQGLGTWSLVANQNFTGNTTVSSGRLNVQGDVISTINVAGGATFGGGGSTTGNLTFDSAGVNFVFDNNQGAFGAADLTVTTGGSKHTVFIEGAAPVGVTDILTFTGTFSSSADINDDFQLDAGVVDSERGAQFGTTANSVTLDLGFKSLVWNNGAANDTWDNASVLGMGNASLNWTGSDEFFNGDSVTFGDTGVGTVTLASAATANSVDFAHTSGTYQLDGASTLTLTGGLLHSGAGDVTINVSLAGAGGLTKDGAGALEVAGNNSFAGAVALNAGTTTLSSLTGFGGGIVTLSNTGTTLEITGTGGTVTNQIVFSTAGNTKTLRTNLTGTASLTLTGNITLDEPSSFRNVFDIGADDTLELTTGLISGDGGIAKSGTGTLRLSNNANTFGAGAGNQIRISRGILEVTSIGDIGEASAAGMGDQIRIGNGNREGTLSYVGPGDESTNRTVQIGSDSGDGGAIIQTNSGSGTLSFTALQFNIALGDTGMLARTLQLTGDNTGDNSIDGIIVDNTGAAAPADNFVSVNKTGSGKWILGGANTYSGTTTVSAGTLIINGVQSGAAGEVTVSSGATLGGTGTLGGNVVISAGATQTGGDVVSDGTMNFNENLTYQSGGGTTISWDLVSASGGNFDRFVLDGSGTLDFATGAGEIEFAINNLDAGFNIGMDQDFLVWSGYAAVLGADDIDMDGHLDDFVISYSGTAGISSSNFQVFRDVGGATLGTEGIWLRFTAVPEPGTYAVMGVGLTALGWLVRRRRLRPRKE